MRFQIENGVEPGPGLGRILEALAADAAEALRTFRESPEEQIHRLRTDMKKMRALIRLARAELPAEAFGQVLRDIRTLKDGYAGSRDEVVLQRLLQRTATPLEASALPELFDGSQHEPSEPSADLVRAAERLREELARLPFWAVTATGIGNAFAQTRRKGASAMRECRVLQTDHAFHEWRKCVKVFWYQAAILRDPRARRAARVSEKLGEANDLANLRLRLHPLLPGVLPEALRERLEQNLAAAREKALDRGRKLYSE